MLTLAALSGGPLALSAAREPQRRWRPSLPLATSTPSIGLLWRANPQDVTLTLRFAGSTSTFHQGELIPIERAFASTSPGRYGDHFATSAGPDGVAPWADARGGPHTQAFLRVRGVAVLGSRAGQPPWRKGRADLDIAATYSFRDGAGAALHEVIRKWPN